MQEENNPKIPWWQPGVVLFARMSSWIVGPVIIGVVVGKWLDNKYNTAPKLFLLSVGIMFLISIFGIIRDAYKELRRIKEKEAKDKK